ncbi:LptF/LptG family permease [Pararhizobium mangrovi]|nr:LptF/LptG family permease [Pararhizobium mangrovi]
MNQIQRYIFRRIFLLSIGTLIVTGVLAMTTQILLYVNVMTSTSQSLMTYGELALMLMPKVLIIVMPFALLIGAGQTLGRMNEDSELVVAEAAGAPPRTVGKPLLLIAVGMAFVTLLSNNFVEPYSNHRLRDIVTEARGDLLSSAIQTGTFTKLDDNVYFNVQNVASGGELRGIFISDERDPASNLTYFAKSGRLVRTDETQLLVLSDGQFQTQNTKTGEVSIVRFQSYALDLALFPGGGEGTLYYPKERPTTYLFSPDPNDKAYRDRPDLFTKEINRRFSEWMYPLLVGLVALSFMGRAKSNRAARIQQSILAFLIVLFYRALGFYIEPDAGRSLLFGYLIYGVPLFGIASYAFLVLTGKEIWLPQSWVNVIARIWLRTRRAIGGLFIPGRRRSA